MSPYERNWRTPTLAGVALAVLTLAVWKTLPRGGILVGGLLMAALLAWAVALAEANQRLRAEMSEAEDRARESRDALSALIEASPLAIFTFDMDAHIETWSVAAERLFGWSEAEARGRFLPFVPEDKQDESRALCRRLLRGEVISGVEARRQKRDGSSVDISIHAAPLRDKAGQVTGAMALVADVSERRRAEEELRESKRFAESVAEHSAGILFVFDLDTMSNAYSNRDVAEFLGYSPEQIQEMGANILPTILHPDDLPRVVQHLQAFRRRADDQVVELEYRVRHVSGEWRWIWNRERVFRRHEDGTPYQTMGTAQDITDWKRAEEALNQARAELELRVRERTSDLAIVNDWLHNEIGERRLAEEALRQAHDELERRVQERTEALNREQDFLRALLNSLQEGIIACDAAGTLTVFNQTTRDFHGLPDASLPPEEWAAHFDLYRADGATPMPTEEIPLFRAWQGEIVRNAELVIAPKNGKRRALMVNGQAIQNAQGQTLGAVVAMHDITERKEIDRLKNEFVSVVSHELRTPLTSILGALGLMVGGVVGRIPSPARKLIDIAHVNTSRLVRLTNDILDIEKMDAGKMDFPLQPVPLMPRVHQALDSLRAEATQCQVTLALDEDLPNVTVCAESDRLMQVLTNLLSNALKFSPAGQRVSVCVSRHESWVRLSVRDHGPGIPPEFQPRVFQKFAQADGADSRLRGGTGLGLSICKGLVEKFGGEIGFETAADQGTTFQVDLREHCEEGKAHDSSNH